MGKRCCLSDKSVETLGKGKHLNLTGGVAEASRITEERNQPQQQQHRRPLKHRSLNGESQFVLVY